MTGSSQEPSFHPASFHQRHHALLADLGSDAVMSGVLDRIGSRSGWWSEGRRWERTWARIVDPESARVSLSFRSTDDPVETCVVDRGGTGDILDEVIGPVRAIRFPDDPALPTLRAVIAADSSARVVRYRPGKRCTLRSTDPERRYLKVFADSRGDRLHREAVMLWEASCRGRLGFEVARPLGFDEPTNTYAQSEVSGSPALDSLRSCEGPALAARLGAAAASIPRCGARPSDRLDGEAELSRARRRVSEIVTLVPGLGVRLGELIERLGRAHRRFDRSPLVPIHGSPHPTQWLVDGDRVALVDFDRLAYGDPELDVATFAGEVDFESDDGGTDRRMSEVSEAFAEGYRSAHGALDPLRLSTYRAHKRLAKAYRTARSLKVDADRRAAAHLERALEVVP